MSDRSVERRASEIEGKMRSHQIRIYQAQNEARRTRGAGAGSAAFDESKKLGETDRKKQDEIAEEVENFLEEMGRSNNANSGNDAAIYKIGQVCQNLEKTEDILQEWRL